MNQRLKTLVHTAGLDAEKIAALVALFGGDETFVAQMLTERVKSHDAAHLLSARYKAAPARYDPATDPLARLFGADQANR